MTKKIRFEWEPTRSGGAQCEVALGSKCLSIGVEPVDSPWEKAVWMIHTPHRGDARKLDANLAMSLADGKTAAEAAARAWLRTTPELRVIE
ncbi:hypothetical protein RsS62_46180 [Rhizobium dioscoreae]|uniref:hypothetical protein n=1 Tax=Rhizobium dioscoreae TaxID=2653122 RepID=UPI0012612F77|nr:hypothetical protein [Rhizobium dioscoreae]GES45366.1 hypothetical protein RsS62_46180 [Rhizobium dioscoreae]